MVKKIIIIPIILFFGAFVMAHPVNKPGSNVITLILDTIGPTCAKNNGIISITAYGGVAPYTYSITGYVPQTFGFFRQVGPGTYNILVTDNLGQNASETITFVNTFTPPSASATFTNPTGCSTYDASITVNGSGGQSPYLFSIDQVHFQSNNYFPYLTAGSYRYTVKDANGCQSATTVFNNLLIPVNCAINQNGIGTSFSCNPDLTTLALHNVNGGTPPYLYSLDGINYQTSYQFSNGVPPGLYTIWVKDAAGLILLFTVAVGDRCPPAFLVTTELQDAQCGIDGKITIHASLGKSPYEYSINGSNYQFSNQFTGLAPGGYTVKVRDSNNIIQSVYVILLNNCLSVTATGINSTCGNNNGSITVQASNGTSPYMYSINSVNFIPGNTFTGLAAGAYSIMAKDAAGLVGYVTRTISNANGPAINSVLVTPTECTTHNGVIEMVCQGGTPPLLYSIDGVTFVSSPVFNGLPAGVFDLKVKDATGCMNSIQATVGLNNTVTVDAGSAVPVCEGKGITLNGSTNAQQFIWSPSAGLNNPSTLNPVATPGSTVTYYLTARSGECSNTDSVEVVVKPAPVAHAGTNETICYGKNAALSGSGGISCTWQPATYLSAPGIYNPTVIKPLSSILYTLTVTGANGCSSVNNSTVEIIVTPAAKLFAGNDTSVAVNQPLQLNALDLNASGFTQYSWSPAIGLNDPFIKSPTAVLRSDISYVAVARTAAGCEGTDTINIKVFRQPDIFVPSAFTPNGDGNNEVLKAIPVGIRTFRSFAVYDRYGSMVFYTKDPSKGWDGRTNNVLNNTGGYIWIAIGVDYLNKEIIRKGSTILIR